jgi:hypothetical protein
VQPTQAAVAVEWKFLRNSDCYRTTHACRRTCQWLLLNWWATAWVLRSSLPGNSAVPVHNKQPNPATGFNAKMFQSHPVLRIQLHTIDVTMQQARLLAHASSAAISCRCQQPLSINAGIQHVQLACWSSTALQAVAAAAQPLCALACYTAGGKLKATMHGFCTLLMKPVAAAFYFESLHHACAPYSC